MIVSYHGTTFITADCFRDRYDQAMTGRTFSYATGDFANICTWNKDARELRDLTHKMVDQKKIALTQIRRPDLKMQGGGVGFEYLATKRSESHADR